MRNSQIGEKKMNKCKRSIFIIFGYLFLIAILFVPFAEEEYYIPEYWNVETQTIIPSPPPGFVLERQNNITPRAELSGRPLNHSGFKFFPFCIVDVIKHKQFRDWKKQVQLEGNKITKDKQVLSTEEAFYFLETEFLKRYRGSFRYIRIKTEIYSDELVIIVLTGTLFYILFCVVFRKRT